jgi:hypothetical protein
MSLAVSDRVRSTTQLKSLEKHLVDQPQRHQRIMPGDLPRIGGAPYGGTDNRVGGAGDRLP